MVVLLVLEDGKAWGMRLGKMTISCHVLAGKLKVST